MDSNYNFTFFQDSLMTTSFGSFGEMRKNGELTDFKITLGTKFVVGHKVIVAAAVPYLRTAFTTRAAEITLDEVEPDILDAVVDFAYSGRIQIAYKNVVPLLRASKFLQLNEVYSACWEFLEKVLQTNNAWEIRMLAENHQRSELTDIIDNFIRQNFEEFSESKDFEGLPYSYLKEVVRRDDVKISKEEKMFEAIIRWVKVSPSNRKAVLSDLLDGVRFKYLSLQYLTERVSSEELVTNIIPCKLWVDEAKRYHVLPTHRKSLFDCFCTQPRIYDTNFQQEINTDAGGIYAICKSKSVICVKLLDTNGETWIQLSTFTHKFLDNAIAVNERIYIFLRETMLMFDINKWTWHLLDAVHDPSYSSGVVLHNGKLYLFGGDENLADGVRCFDPQLEKWLPEEKMMKWCENPGVASSGDYIYVTGGHFEGDVFRSSERYDPVSKEWSQICQMLSERVSHGCASLNDKIYVCGGYNEEYKNLGTGEVYDPFTNQWNSISPLKVLSWRISLVSNNGKLYALERMPTLPNSPVDVQIYDPEYDQWKLGVPVPQEDVHEIFLVSATKECGLKVKQSHVMTSNNCEEASDDDEDWITFSSTTNSNGEETSADSDDGETFDDENAKCTDEEF